MGFWNGDQAVITDVTGPGPRAVHHARSCDADHDHEHAECDRIYIASRGLHTYLGDWHTHPNGPAQLSRIDLSSLDAIANCTAQRLANGDLSASPRGIMLLLAGAEPWTVRAWCWAGGRAEPMTVRAIEAAA